MKIKLYPCFEHWLEFNNIFLISDPHFNDPEMIHLRKNYISDEEQVKRINTKVGKKDLLICLGDCGDLEFIKKIRGYKVLIKGNHDDKGDDFYKRMVITDTEYGELPEDCSEAIMSHFRNDKLKTKAELVALGYKPTGLINAFGQKFEKITDNHLFDEVYPGPVWIAEKILLSHEPIDIPYAFNIHGHDHANWFSNDHHLNLCAEHIDYTPVSLLSLIKNGTFSKVDSIHRQTIDNATERKLNKNKKSG